jgi:hypothetical protein
MHVTRGGGAHFYDDWVYVNWEVDVPNMQDSHINILELEMVHQAAVRWGQFWGGHHVLIRSDNAATVASVNKGSTRSVPMLRIIEKLFWLSVLYGFKLSASFLPGIENVLADRISRMMSVDSASDTQMLLSNGSGETIECINHMSYRSYLLLQETWRLDRLINY